MTMDNLRSPAPRGWALLMMSFVILGAGAASLAANAAEPRQVLFIAGPPSHGSGEHEFPAGAHLLAEALNRSGLPLSATVSLGWPTNDRAFRGVDAVVLYGDGLGAHVAKGKSDDLRQQLETGTGLAVLHFALEPPEDDPTLRELLLNSLGGIFEAGWSVNPTWMLQAAPVSTHPVGRGVGPLRIEDEWYYHLRFAADRAVRPVLTAQPGADTLGADGPRSGNSAVRAALAAGEPQILAWTHQPRPDARAFGFTGGHFHRNWYDDAFRTLVLNGIVWAAGSDVPSDGVRSTSPSAPLYATIEEAIARGDADEVKRHLEEGPDRLHGAPEAKLTPLHQAILRRKPEIVAILLDRGADPMAADGMDRTPLHMAVVRGDEAIVDALLQRDADPTRRDRQGWTPLHHAAAKNEVEIGRLLLAHGTDPNILSALGGTPLHEAAAGGGIEMVRLLLDAGTDPTVRSKTGVTALDVAREYERQDVVALLETLPTER